MIKYVTRIENDTAIGWMVRRKGSSSKFFNDNKYNDDRFKSFYAANNYLSNLKIIQDNELILPVPGMSVYFDLSEDGRYFRFYLKLKLNFNPEKAEDDDSDYTEAERRISVGNIQPVLEDLRGLIKPVYESQFAGCDIELDELLREAHLMIFNFIENAAVFSERLLSRPANKASIRVRD